MRALVCDGRTTCFEDDRPVPVPAEGEVLVRPVLTALDGQDLAAARGLGAFRGVPGRAFVGIADAAGDGGDRLAGRRVVANPATFCGRCERCTGGLRQHCRARSILGLSGRDGCLADFVAVPVANLMPLPDAVDNDHGVFAVLLAAALQSARQLTVEGKPYITVLGDGPLGLLTAQVMSRLNASVRVVGRHAAKIGLCEKWGVKHRLAGDVGRRADQDVVVECTGEPDGLALAMRLVRPRGTILLKSLTPLSDGASALDLAPLVTNEIHLVGSFAGSISEAVAELERDAIDVVSLISRRMRLDDGPAIFAALQQPESLSVLVSH